MPLLIKSKIIKSKKAQAKVSRSLKNNVTLTITKIFGKEAYPTDSSYACTFQKEAAIELANTILDFAQ